jgi:glutathione synthase/RimK-type ligase-like ATP-grasp enzyme
MRRADAERQQDKTESETEAAWQAHEWMRMSELCYSISMTEADPQARTSGRPFMGLAVLMSMACAGVPLTDTAKSLMARIARNPLDAEALMDLSIISHLWFKHDLGLATQALALRIRRCYSLPAAGVPALRLLALMHPGDLAANAPLEFLLQDSDVALEMLFLDPEAPLPEALPEHDLVIVAVAESAAARPLLERIAQAMPNTPFVNRPERIARLARESVSKMLQGLPGVAMPPTATVPRAALEKGAPFPYPLIVRPLDSHAGQGLEKIGDAAALQAYLAEHAEAAFSLSPFVDYRDADGLYRKYRVVIVDGKAYAGHMALSDHWMIHYLNAHMSESEAKRAEEAAFMADFDAAFGRRHAAALEAIDRAAGLDYLVIDCAESHSGALLVFEIDSAAVIHGMDPADTFPYKQNQVRKIVAAFRALLQSRMEKARGAG